MPLTLAGEKVRRGRLKAAGVCRFHVGRSAVSVTRCQECLDKEARRGMRRRKEAADLGVCSAHLDRTVQPGKTTCWECGILDRIKDAGLLLPEREVVLEAFRSFDGRCQCCGCSEPGSKGWCLDHDHATKKFRGIVCSACNTMLGMARDSISNLAAGIRYLIEYARRQPVAAQSDSGSIPDRSTEGIETSL